MNLKTKSFVAGSLALVAALLNIGALVDIISFISPDPASAITSEWGFSAIAQLVGILICFVLAILTLVLRKPIFAIIAGAAVAVGTLIFFLKLVSFIVESQRPVTEAFFLPSNNLSWASVLPALAAILVALLRVKPDAQSDSTFAQQGNASPLPSSAMQMPMQGSTETAADIAVGTQATLALIMAIIIPIVGIVLGHLGLSKMNRDHVGEIHRGKFKAALIVGYIFIGLGILSGIIIGIGFGLYYSRLMG